MLPIIIITNMADVNVYFMKQFFNFTYLYAVIIFKEIKAMVVVDAFSQ